MGNETRPNPPIVQVDSHLEVAASLKMSVAEMNDEVAEGKKAQRQLHDVSAKLKRIEQENMTATEQLRKAKAKGTLRAQEVDKGLRRLRLQLAQAQEREASLQAGKAALEHELAEAQERGTSLEAEKATLETGKAAAEEKLRDVSTLLETTQNSLGTIDGALSHLEEVDISAGLSPDALAQAVQRARTFESKLVDAERAARDAERAARDAELERVEREREAAEQCPVCLDASKDVAFQCGHRTCGECAEQLSTCPICMTDITTRMKIF